MTDFESMEPYQRLALAREKAGYATASEAARSYGWNENTYRSHENGERGLRIGVARKYAQAFKVTAEYLILGKESRFIKSSVRRVISGCIDEDGTYREYSAAETAGKNKIIANTNYILGNVWPIEIISKRPVLGCFAGDLLVVSDSKARLADLQGRLAILEIENGDHIFRRVRLGYAEGTVDAQLYPDLQPEIVTCISAYFVHAIVQHGAWDRTTLREFEEGHDRWLSERGT